jgi:hypothetical protein
MNLKNKKSIENNKEKLPFSSSIYNRDNFEDFCKLEIDWTIKSIDKNDLPGELSDETCKFINLFRRRTANEKNEWNLYIDYENNEIIHCLHGGMTNVCDLIHSELMKNRKIVSVHNHPPHTYSAPSAQNFEILEHEFEDFEIICATDEFWILEAKGKYSQSCIEKIRRRIKKIFFNCELESFNPKKSKTYNSNIEYGKRLTKYINNLKNNIKLSKKEYREYEK